MPEGKYFIIRSQLHGKVLDVKNANISDGEEVIIWEHNGGENQIWFQDYVSCTIRPKGDGSLCLHYDGEKLILKEHDPDDANQKWLIAGNKITNAETGDVLDIADQCEDDGAKVIGYPYNGGANQQWDLEFRPRQCFYIVSRMHGKVLDICGEDPSVGATLCMWDKHDPPKDNQIWYEDRRGIIHSKLNDLVLDFSDGELKMNIQDPQNDNQKWLRHGRRIVLKNDPNRCLDIKGESHKRGAQVTAWDYKGSDNQHWKFELYEEE